MTMNPPPPPPQSQSIHDVNEVAEHNDAINKIRSSRAIRLKRLESFRKNISRTTKTPATG